MAAEDKGITPSEGTGLSGQTDAKQTEELAKPAEQGSQALGDVTDEELEAELAFEALRRKRAKAKRRRIIIGILVLLVVGGVGAFFFLSGGSQEAENAIDPFSMTATITKDKFTDTVGGNGKANPASSSVVSPEVSGIIENLDVTVGQEVKEGDVLFTLKNDALDEEVRKAEEAVSLASRGLDSAWSKISKAERARDVAVRSRDDAWNKANEAGDWSTYDDNTLTNAIDDATDGINDAIDAKDTAEADLASKQADLENARKKAEKRTVTAPVTGSVIAVNAQNGQAVGGAEGGTTDSSGSNSGPLVRIADTSQMKIPVQINEVDIEKIAVDQPATVTFQAIPDLTLDSKVQNIATTSTGSSGASNASAADSSGGVVTYAVDLSVANKEGKIKPGMTANVNIITQQLDDVLTVSSSAVFGEELGSPHVLRVTDAENKAYESVPVEIKAKSSSTLVIEGDVKEGDEVLLINPEAPAGSGAEDVLEAL